MIADEEDLLLRFICADWIGVELKDIKTSIDMWHYRARRLIERNVERHILFYLGWHKERNTSGYAYLKDKIGDY